MKRSAGGGSVVVDVIVPLRALIRSLTSSQSGGIFSVVTSSPAIFQQIVERLKMTGHSLCRTNIQGLANVRG